MKRVFITVAVLIVCAAAAQAQGMDCLYNSSPCEAYATADAVFIGKVTRVVQPPLKIWQREKDYDQIAYLEVQRMFKGAARKTIVLHQLGRNNAPKLLSDKSYLIYAMFDRHTKKWEVRRCGRTRMSPYANDDLLYLESLPSALNKTRIAGEVTLYSSTEEEMNKIERLANVRMHIKGEGKEYEVVTNARGVYEVSDVPPGKYVIEPDLPAGLEVMGVMHYGLLDYAKIKSLSFEVPARGCSGADIILKPRAPAKSTIGVY
jgi:hypothetical protein